MLTVPQSSQTALPQVDQNYLLMAAGVMNEQGRLVIPEINSVPDQEPDIKEDRSIPTENDNE
jgi:hypothetical protein